MSERRANPLIISASRRTDLPGFYADALKMRLLEKISRLRTRYLHGVVFWTRHTRPFLPGKPLHELVSTILDNSVLNLTITGLGGTRLEPGVPNTDSVLSDIPVLVNAFHGEGWRIRWRYDPILKGFSDLGTFRRIATVMAECGVLTCTFSFPTYFSLKGNLAPYFSQAGIGRFEEGEKTAVVERLVSVAKPLGIRLLSCAQPDNVERHPYIEPAQCIPKDVLERGDPGHRLLKEQSDRSQRAQCRCLPSEDIGDYVLDRCGGGCVYCYSKAGGPSPNSV